MYPLPVTGRAALGVMLAALFLGVPGMPGLLRVPGATSPAVASGARLSASPGAWPTDAPHIVLRPFEAPATRYSAGHRGIDIAATPGQPVYAVLAGTVSFAGVVVDRPLVSVSHGDGLLSSVEPVTPMVVEGETVAAGQQIGVVATSAHCELGCVHLGLRLDGAYISPLRLFGAIPRAVLLPSWHASG